MEFSPYGSQEKNSAFMYKGQKREALKFLTSVSKDDDFGLYVIDEIEEVSNGATYKFILMHVGTKAQAEQMLATKTQHLGADVRKKLARCK